jgi:hypothetical protein
MQTGPSGVVGEVSEEARLGNRPALADFNPAVSLVDGFVIVTISDGSFLGIIKQVPDRHIQRALIFFESQDEVCLLSDDLLGDLGLAAEGIMVTIQPASAKACSKSGMAVISFDLSATLSWPNTSWFSSAQALTIWMAFLPSVLS